MSGETTHHRPTVQMREQNLWCLMSVHFGTLRPRSVHPASPVLLTKNGPLIALDPSARVQLSNGGLAPIRSSRVREGRYAPQTPNRCSTGCDSLATAILRETSAGTSYQHGSGPGSKSPGGFDYLMEPPAMIPEARQRLSLWTRRHAPRREAPHALRVARAIPGGSGTSPANSAGVASVAGHGATSSRKPPGGGDDAPQWFD